MSIIILVAGSAFGWYSWYQSEADDLKQLTEKNALLTARVWIATARFRNDSTGFAEYRDSLLVEEVTSVDEIDRFLKMYENEPEKYMRFSNLVSMFVDSLSKLEDVLLWEEAAPDKSGDSLLTDSAVTPQPRMR